MTEYEIGEDVIVEHDAILGGKAFQTQIVERAFATLVVDVSDRDAGSSLLHVLPEKVTPLSEVIDHE